MTVFLVSNISLSNILQLEYFIIYYYHIIIIIPSTARLNLKIRQEGLHVNTCILSNAHSQDNHRMIKVGKDL